MRHLAHACSWRCLTQWKEDRAGTESIFEAAHAPTLSCDAPFNDLQLGSQPKVFDLNMNRKDNWVKPEMLKRMLNPGGGGGCSVM